MDTSGVEIPLLPTLISFILPGYSSTSTTIFVEASSDVAVDGGADAGDPCAALNGISFQVTGHPEATFTYYDTSSIPMATGGTSTTASGRAAITGLPANQLVTVTGTKTGCTVSLAEGVETGRAPLQAGYVTLMPAHVKD